MIYNFFVYYRSTSHRRRRRRHKSRLSLESSPDEEEENRLNRPEVPKMDLSSSRKSSQKAKNEIVSSRKSSHKSINNAKRNLSEELAQEEPRIQRTTSWVADLAKSSSEQLEG